MADITIESATATTNTMLRAPRTQIFTSALIGYQFFMDSAADIAYRKTTDGGQTWGSPVIVFTGTALRFDIYYDGRVPGDSGTKIHIVYMETATDDVFYNYLDTASDTLGTAVQVFDGATLAGNTTAHCSITKLRGGNLLLAFNGDTGAETGTYRSTNGGASWTARVDINEATSDSYLLFPGNESDPNDAWIVFDDQSATQLSLKVYDDSANTISEAAIVTKTGEFVTNGLIQFSGAVRLSDGHLIVATHNSFDVAGNDLLAFDINGTASIVALADVVTNSDDCAQCCVSIDQNNDDIYVGYVGKSDGSETFASSVKTYYKKSTDNGASWGSEMPLADSAADSRTIWCDPGGTSGRFMPSWHEETLKDIITNYTNSVGFAPSASTPATVTRVAAAGTVPADAWGAGITNLTGPAVDLPATGQILTILRG